MSVPSHRLGFIYLNTDALFRTVFANASSVSLKVWGLASYHKLSGHITVAVLHTYAGHGSPAV